MKHTNSNVNIYTPHTINLTISEGEVALDRNRVKYYYTNTYDVYVNCEGKKILLFIHTYIYIGDTYLIVNQPNGGCGCGDD